jgi:hypothetical protein
VITLPDADFLVTRIQDALYSVDAKNRADPFPDTKSWFPAIASEIAMRIPELDSYARGTPSPCCGAERLFDFCGLLYDPETPKLEYFPAQAAIIGEIEWNKDDVDRDFGKLFFADALVLFMVFQQFSAEAVSKQLDWLEDAVKQRKKVFRLRNASAPLI